MILSNLETAMLVCYGFSAHLQPKKYTLGNLHTNFKTVCITLLISILKYWLVIIKLNLFSLSLFPLKCKRPNAQTIHICHIDKTCLQSYLLTWSTTANVWVTLCHFTIEWQHDCQLSQSTETLSGGQGHSNWNQSVQFHCFLHRTKFKTYKCLNAGKCLGYILSNHVKRVPSLEYWSYNVDLPWV